MRILILEDRVSAVYHILEELKEMGHKVVYCSTILDALNELNAKDKIDCMVVDLNMDPIGLEEEEIAETEGGNLTGWILLKNYVLDKNLLDKSKIILYSAYLDALREKLREYGKENDLEGIVRISKNQLESSIEALFKGINEIDKKYHK
jgi:CheY-like chemotaxis protein